MSKERIDFTALQNIYRELSKLEIEVKNCKNSLNDLRGRYLRSEQIDKNLKRILELNQSKMSVYLPFFLTYLNGLVSRNKEIYYYENWGKVLLPYKSGIIRKESLRNKKYLNSSPTDNNQELHIKDTRFEERYYIGIDPTLDYVTQDLVVIRADTPADFAEFWHLHTNTHEYVFCYGEYEVIVSSEENSCVETKSFSTNDMIIINRGTRHSMQSIDTRTTSNFCAKPPQSVYDNRTDLPSFPTKSTKPGVGKIPLATITKNVKTSEGLHFELPYTIKSITLLQDEGYSFTESAKSLAFIVEGQAAIEEFPTAKEEFFIDQEKGIHSGDVIVLDSGMELKVKNPNSEPLVIFQVIKKESN